MPYLLDRQRALYESDLVAILNVHHHRVRSRAIFKDNSLYQTLSRVQTMVRRSQNPGAMVLHGTKPRRGSRKGAIWWKQR